MAELLASPGVSGLVLQADGRDAGIALCRVAADEAELLTIAVGRPIAGAARAGALLAAVIERVRDAGARTLFLEVGADNPAARALYEAMGFQVIGRARPTTGAARDRRRMPSSCVSVSVDQQ